MMWDSFNVSFNARRAPRVNNRNSAWNCQNSNRLSRERVGLSGANRPFIEISIKSVNVLHGEEIVIAATSALLLILVHLYSFRSDILHDYTTFPVSILLLR